MCILCLVNLPPTVNVARVAGVQWPIVQDIMYLWALAETYTADADMQQEMR